MDPSRGASVPGLPAQVSPRVADSPPLCLPVLHVPRQSAAVSRPSASRDWYMNGNYLVILVSLTIILPLALMKQLGKSVMLPATLASGTSVLRWGDSASLG